MPNLFTPATMLMLIAFTGSPSDPYLNDLLKKPDYLAAHNKMMGSSSYAPAWLKGYSKTLDGVTHPAISAGEYTMAEVCKPHDCGANDFYVLFAPDGKQAWGLLLTGGKLCWCILMCGGRLPSPGRCRTSSAVLLSS